MKYNVTCRDTIKDEEVLWFVIDANLPNREVSKFYNDYWPYLIDLILNSKKREIWKSISMWFNFLSWILIWETLNKNKNKFSFSVVPYIEKDKCKQESERKEEFDKMFDGFLKDLWIWEHDIDQKIKLTKWILDLLKLNK